MSPLKYIIIVIVAIGSDKFVTLQCAVKYISSTSILKSKKSTGMSSQASAKFAAK